MNNQQEQPTQELKELTIGYCNECRKMSVGHVCDYCFKHIEDRIE